MQAPDTSIRVDAAALNKLVALAGQLVQARDQFRAVCERALAVPEPPVPALPQGRRTLVLFATPDDGRMAMPLADVAGLLEVDRGEVSERDGLRFVPWAGAALPLVPVRELVPERRARPRRERVPVTGRRLQVIVHRSPHGCVGLEVDRLLDVFEDELRMAQPGSRSGAHSAVLLRGRVTELVDLEALVSRVDPALRVPEPVAAHENATGVAR